MADFNADGSPAVAPPVVIPPVTPPPAVAPPVVQNTAPWHTGVDPALAGVWQNKGWNTADPKTVAIEATKAYTEAQKFVGAPAAQLVRLPTDPMSDEWKGVYSRLGVPADPKDYDFSQVKFADGAGLDPAADAFIRQQAYTAHISKDAAAGFASGLVKFLEGAEATDATERQGALAAERQTLQTNWGVNFEANKFVAQRGAAALGLDDAAVTALEGQIGYAKVMEAMRKVGVLSGEARFISAGLPGSNGVMTREGASARKAELMTDKAWTTRFLAGDKTAVSEMTSLNTLIAGSRN